MRSLLAKAQIQGQPSLRTSLLIPSRLLGDEFLSLQQYLAFCSRLNPSSTSALSCELLFGSQVHNIKQIHPRELAQCDNRCILSWILHMLPKKQPHGCHRLAVRGLLCQGGGTRPVKSLASSVIHKLRNNGTFCLTCFPGRRLYDATCWF